MINQHRNHIKMGRLLNRFGILLNRLGLVLDLKSLALVLQNALPVFLIPYA